MSASPTATQAGADRPPLDDWASENRRHLEAYLHRLRLLLRRRVLWLRRRWGRDPLRALSEVLSDERADALLAPDEAAASTFYHEDPAAAELTAALAAQQAELERHADHLREHGAPPAIVMVAEAFGLSRFERDVLVLTFAPQRDADFGRLYGYLQDDLTRAHATGHLALSLLPEPDAAALTPDAPLRRHGLVSLIADAVTANHACPLVMDERVAAYLDGHNHLDERLTDALRPLPALPVGPQHGALAERLASWVRRRRGTGWPALELVGGPHSGARAVAAAVGAALGVGVFELDVAAVPPVGQRGPWLRLLARDAVLTPFALFIEDDEAAWLDDLDALVLVARRRPRPSPRPTLTVALAPPTPEERQALWQAALATRPHAVDGALAPLVQQFAFGPDAVAAAAGRAWEAAQVRAMAEGTGSPTIDADDLWQACRQQGLQGLDVLAQPLSAVATWDMLVLPDEALAQLRAVAQQVAGRARVYDAWGFGERLTRGRGIAALFAGPSGTGKTLAAEVLAGDLGLELYRIDLASVVSKYIGETEKNLARVFDAAEASGAILFFDEADALFGKRSEVRDSHDRYANIEIDYLLQRMELYTGLAVLATNRKADLDRAFLRRLRFLIEFPFPDAGLRRRLWQGMFPRQAPLDDLDWEVLSRLELTGGSIRVIALNAAFLAAAEDRPIGMGHVLQAARREYAKLDRPLREAEFGGWRSDGKERPA